MGPHPAVAAVRLAVRRSLQRHADSGQPVLVACSGGADSVALAAAAAFECRRTGRPAGLVTVDHQLQDGSAAQARRVAALGWELGFDPVHLLVVDVATGPAAGGPEAAARSSRYAALDRTRRVRADGLDQLDSRAPLVLLGHTMDDQAETVLLGLGRGSGPQSIQGMSAARHGYLRPLLGLRRADTLACCRELGLPVWSDPHNSDPRYRRVRLRHDVLPLLEDVLGGGVVEALARTAEQLQQDQRALAELARQAWTQATTAEPDPSGGLLVEAMRVQPAAIQSRVLRLWAQEAGVRALTAAHLGELSRLLTEWRGQGPIDLPGGYRARRSSGRLELFRSSPPATLE